jgi:hypothetical protein
MTRRRDCHNISLADGKVCPMFLHKGQLGAPCVALGEIREDPLAIAS